MAAEAGVLQLSGDPPKWIWAFTCPTPGCDCREAIVLATDDDDRDALIAAGAPVRKAWLARESYAKAAARLKSVAAFAVTIDDGEIYSVDGASSFSPFDFAAHPEARDVIGRIDGEALEAFGRLWYRSKGWPNPDDESLGSQPIKILSWKPGETVSWGESLVGVREDLYIVGDRLFEAVDHYCVEPDCDCGDVVLDFQPLTPRGAPPPGGVRVDRSGAATFELTHEKHRASVERLWTLFRMRHLGYRERFARRRAVMHGLAGRIVSAPENEIERRSPRVGRNEPCPCGSKKKYKKCCGAA